MGIPTKYRLATELRALLDCAEALLDQVKSNDELPHVLGGLMVGIAQIMQVATRRDDQADAAIRASMIQLAPWAVDMARAMQGNGPLSDA